jgi:elongation factor P
MAYVITNEMKPGLKIEVDGQPYTIVSNDAVKPGKGQAFNRIKLKHLMTGRTIERTFKSGDRADLADVVEASMRLLYREADGAVFMDEKTYDQIKIPNENLADTSQWLREDHLYGIVFYNGAAVAVQPPTFMEFRIIETSAGARGDTSGRVLKPATIETGAIIQVPIFVNQDEMIKVDTRTGEYVSRVST